MPGDSGVLVYSCAFLPMQSAHEAAGAAGTRRSPRPLLGGRFMHNSGASRRGVVKSYLKFEPSLPATNAKRLRKGALATIAVGTPIAERPPHRTVRAAFPHTAPTSSE